MEEIRKVVLIRRVILSLREKKGVFGGEVQVRDLCVYGLELGQVKFRVFGWGESWGEFVFVGVGVGVVGGGWEILFLGVLVCFLR